MLRTVSLVGLCCVATAASIALFVTLELADHLIDQLANGSR